MRGARPRRRAILDFVVEFSDKSFDAYMDLKSFLEDLFRSRVDLVTVSSIKQRLLPIIQRETVYASGRQPSWGREDPHDLLQ